ncbi:glycosidase [candidate division KSB1 bacterium]
MKKRIVNDLFHRWEGNPIIELDDIPFRCNTVFNGTSVKYGDEYLILLRIEGQQGYSFFALARSHDGIHFIVDNKPTLLPAKEGIFGKYETFGIEDPRATFIDGAYYIMYTASSGHGPRIALARTDDFRTFERIALISEPGNKDGVLFPEKIDDLYVRLDRPIGQGVGSIWISFSKDLIHWGSSKVLITPRHGYWDSYRIGASVPPIRTDHGWLEIYHGVHMTSSGPIYRTGTLLLDLENPSQVISRSDAPSLSPREEYERVGEVGNVVFPCGAIVEDDGDIKMYYGAADTSLCLATTNLEELIKSTMNR